MSELLQVRVMVEDVWDEVALEATGVHEPAGEFEAKFRGALLMDEDRSVADVGMVKGSSIILVPRRRRPVR